MFIPSAYDDDEAGLDKEEDSGISIDEELRTLRKEIKQQENVLCELQKRHKTITGRTFGGF